MKAFIEKRMMKVKSLASGRGSRETRVLLLGLDASGKTTLLYKMKLGEVVTTIPTIGFNVENVEIENSVFTIWDVGGQDKIRPLWRHYLQSTQLVAYCVDSNDASRFQEAGRELGKILLDPEIANVPVLIIANKQDLPSARTPAEVLEGMQLSPESLQGRQIETVATCAMTDTEPIAEAFVYMTMGPIKFKKLYGRKASFQPSGAKEPAAPPPETETPEAKELARLQKEKEANQLFCYADGMVANNILLLQRLIEEVDTYTALRPKVATAFSPCAVGFAGRSLPQEVVSIIVSFLPLADILPDGFWHLTNGKHGGGAWAVNQTFLHWSLFSFQHRVLVDNDPSLSFVSDRFRPLLALQVPDSHLLSLLSAISVCLQYFSGADQGVLHTANYPITAFCGSCPLRLAQTIALTWSMASQQLVGFGTKMLEDGLKNMYGPRMDEFEMHILGRQQNLFGDLAESLLWAGTLVMKHGDELFSFEELLGGSPADAESDEAASDMFFGIPREERPLVNELQLSPFFRFDSHPMMAALIEQGKFFSLTAHLEERKEQKLSHRTLTAIARLIMTGGHSCRVVRIKSTVEQHYFTETLLRACVQASPSIFVILMNITGVARAWEQVASPELLKKLEADGWELAMERDRFLLKRVEALSHYWAEEVVKSIP